MYARNAIGTAFLAFPGYLLLENDVKDSICKSAKRQKSVQRLLQPKLEDSCSLENVKSGGFSCSRPAPSAAKNPAVKHTSCPRWLQSASTQAAQPWPSHIDKLMQWPRVKVFLVNTNPGFTHWPALLYTVRT